MGFMAGVSFATASLDKPITKGVYSISRNPMHFLGLLIVCGGTDSLVSIGVVQSEESSLIEKYGDAYQEYMNRTPKMDRNTRRTD